MDDTTREAARMQALAHRRMGPARRLAMALRMSEGVREMARARIRRQHPALDEVAVREQLIWELYGVRRER